MAGVYTEDVDPIGYVTESAESAGQSVAVLTPGQTLDVPDGEASFA